MLPSSRVTMLRRREQHPNLLAAWGFDEGAGATARDSSERNLPLTVGASLTWPAGHSGGTALGNSSGVSGASRPWNITTSITIMGWARPTDLAAGSTRPLFGILEGTSTASNTTCALWAQRGNFSTSNVLQGNVRINGSLAVVNHTALSLNAWVHVALSYDGSTIRLFRDGIEVASAAVAGTINSGAFFFNVLPGPDARAEVDDVRVFNTALPAAQIAMLMGDPVAP